MEPMNMTRGSKTQFCLATVATTVFLVGTAPSLAADTGSQCPKESKQSAPKAAKAQKVKESRAAKRLVSRMEKDLNHMVKQIDRDLRKTMAPYFEALRDLAEAGAADADVDALVAAFDSALADADAAADAAYAAASSAKRDELAAMNPGSKLLARADAIIKRNQRRLDQRVDRIERVFDNRVKEHFPEYQSCQGEDGDDDSSQDAPTSPQPEQPEPPEVGGT
jgi:hypothetical protein